MAKQKKKPMEAQPGEGEGERGTIILAQQVLVTIARHVALSTPGVVGMAPPGRRRLPLPWVPSLPPANADKRRREVSPQRSEPRSGSRRLFSSRKEREPQGVRVRVEDGLAFLDLYVVAERNVNLYRLGQRIQREVSRAIQELVGLPVGEVNVHIQDVAPGRP